MGTIPKALVHLDESTLAGNNRAHRAHPCSQLWSSVFYGAACHVVITPTVRYFSMDWELVTGEVTD